MVNFERHVRTCQSTYSEVSLDALVQPATQEEAETLWDVQYVLSGRTDETSDSVLHNGIIETLCEMDRNRRIDFPSLANGARPSTLRSRQYDRPLKRRTLSLTSSIVFSNAHMWSVPRLGSLAGFVQTVRRKTSFSTKSRNGKLRFANDAT